jgi:hypothetical protein
MIKTQIQLPDDLYKRTKAFAKEHEWSLAETFRRAAEQFMDRYPTEPLPPDEEWTPPAPRDLGWNGLTAEEIKEQIYLDQEPRMP